MKNLLHQTLSAGEQLLIDDFHIDQKFDIRDVQSGYVARDFKHQIVNLLIGYRRHDLAQHLNPVILDHRIRQQLVGGVLQRRLGLGGVGA